MLNSGGRPVYTARGLAKITVRSAPVRHVPEVLGDASRARR